MGLVSLNLETLGDLDSGSTRLVINRALQEAVVDLDDRGEDEKERVVTIKVGMKRAGNITSIAVEAKAALPPRRTNATSAEISMATGKPQLKFQSHNPERPDQATFPALDRDDDQHDD